MADLEPFTSLLRNIVTQGKLSQSRVERIKAFSPSLFPLGPTFLRILLKANREAPREGRLSALYVLDVVLREARDRCKAKAKEGGARDEESFLKDAERVVEEVVRGAMRAVPDEQKPKVRKVVEIWTRASTFDQETLATLRRVLDEPPGDDEEGRGDGEEGDGGDESEPLDADDAIFKALELGKEEQAIEQAKAPTNGAVPNPQAGTTTSAAAPSLPPALQALLAQRQSTGVAQPVPSGSSPGSGPSTSSVASSSLPPSIAAALSEDQLKLLRMVTGGGSPLPAGQLRAQNGKAAQRSSNGQAASGSQRQGSGTSAGPNRSGSARSSSSGQGNPGGSSGASSLPPRPVHALPPRPSFVPLDLDAEASTASAPVGGAVSSSASPGPVATGSTSLGLSQARERGLRPPPERARSSISASSASPSVVGGREREYRERDPRERSPDRSREERRSSSPRKWSGEGSGEGRRDRERERDLSASGSTGARESSSTSAVPMIMPMQMGIPIISPLPRAQMPQAGPTSPIGNASMSPSPIALPDASNVGDLSTFDPTTFQAQDPSHWTMLAMRWRNSFGYAPGNPELLMFLANSIQQRQMRAAHVTSSDAQASSAATTS